MNPVVRVIPGEGAGVDGHDRVDLAVVDPRLPVVVVVVLGSN
jgi:hypothetical protein